MPDPIRIRRSLLFFPADRPDRHPKAVASGADCVIADLEDGVAPKDKEAARVAALTRILPAPRAGGTELILRTNHPKGELGRADLLALRDAEVAPDAVMLPKVASADDVMEVEDLLGPRYTGVPLIPVVETARGLARVEEIATCSPRVTALLFGAYDLSVELGCAVEWEALLYARSRLVHAAALGRVGALDVPLLDAGDAAALERDARAARQLGFVGKAAIHPRQISVLHAVFSPDPAELERARTIVDAFASAGVGAFLQDGKVIDRPVVEAARQVLARAEAIRARSPGGRP